MFMDREIRRLSTLVDKTVDADDVLDVEEIKILHNYVKFIKDKIIIPSHKKDKKTITLIKVLTADLDLSEFFSQVSNIIMYIDKYNGGGLYKQVYRHLYRHGYRHTYRHVYRHVYRYVYKFVYSHVYRLVYIQVYSHVYRFINIYF